MSQASFEEVIRAWLLDLDGRVPSKSKERTRAFLILLGNLEKYGYTKEELNKAKKEKIVRASVNPNHYSKPKLRVWIDMAVNDLENAIQIRYGDIKIDHDVITPEMEAKLNNIEKKIEETKSLATPEKEENEDYNKPLDLEGEPLNIDEVVKKAVENPSPMPQKEFEITDEMLNDINEPAINWDEDFSKRLGLDDDEQS